MLIGLFVMLGIPIFLFLSILIDVFMDNLLDSDDWGDDLMI